MKRTKRAEVPAVIRVQVAGRYETDMHVIPGSARVLRLCSQLLPVLDTEEGYTVTYSKAGGMWYAVSVC